MNKIHEFDALHFPTIKKTWLITKNQRNSIKISNKFFEFFKPYCQNFFKENLLKLYAFILFSIIFLNLFLANLVFPFFSI